MKNGNGNHSNDLPIPTTEPATGMLKIPQPHGGALNAGGTRGNKGGGSEPDIVRRIAREHFATRIPRLASIADGLETITEEYTVLSSEGPLKGSIERKPDFGQQIKALQVLADNAGLKLETHEHLHLNVNITSGGLDLNKLPDHMRQDAYMPENTGKHHDPELG